MPVATARAAAAIAGERLMPALQNTSVGVPERIKSAVVITAIRSSSGRLPDPSTMGNRQ
jgi:hypothetical protein